MKLFKRRKFKITFEKSIVDITPNTGWNYDWTEVTDGCILGVLIKLQETYNFEIIKVILKQATCKSEIIIKCDKKDKNNILFNFSVLLSDKIEKVRI